VAIAVVLAVFPILADVWYLKGRADLAVRVDPLQAQYHWSLGQGLVARHNLRAGIAELQRAADLGETEPSLYVELGDRLAQLGDLDAARAAYRRALTIDRFYTPARRRLSALAA
jgi:Flp pilus assembly protein TadD